MTPNPTLVRELSLVLDFIVWVVDQLEDMGMKVDIETRRASNGLALLLTDVTGRSS